MEQCLARGRIQTEVLTEAAQIEAHRLGRKRGGARESARCARTECSRLETEVPPMRDQRADLHGASQFGARVSAQGAALPHSHQRPPLRHMTMARSSNGAGRAYDETGPRTTKSPCLRANVRGSDAD